MFIKLFFLAVEGFAETDKVIGPILDLKKEYLTKIAANKHLKDIEEAGKWNTIEILTEHIQYGRY